MKNKQENARKKLLSILPRAILEELSNLKSPWHSSRNDLITNAVLQWDEDEVRNYIDKLFNAARR